MEFILCDVLVIAQNRTNFSPAQISSFGVTALVEREQSQESA